MPDSLLGAAAMIAALFEGVNRPRPKPMNARAATRRTSPGRVSASTPSAPELQAGPPGAGAEAALEVERHDEQHSEHDEVRQEAAADAGREGDPLEQSGVDHRGRGPAFVQHEPGDKQTAGQSGDQQHR
jgi:hypothetical protein